MYIHTFHLLLPLRTSVLKILLDSKQFQVVIERLAHQLIENHLSFENTCIIGIQPRGIYLSDMIVEYIEKIRNVKVEYGKLDITFYRDDFKSSNDFHTPEKTVLPFSLTDKNVILVDDVLFTGRTIRAALDALLDFGRPAKVELLTLINRRFSRQLPIQPDYVGKTIDSMHSQKVKVYWKSLDKKDEVVLLNE